MMEDEYRASHDSSNNMTVDSHCTYLPTPVERAMTIAETEVVAAKCGNLEIKPPSESRKWGSVWLDGVEMPYVTSIKLTWEVHDLWRCEIGQIVDERVTGKKKEATE